MNWETTELGFIFNGNELFHINDIRGISKIDNDTIDIHFFARKLSHKFSDPADRNSIFEWLKKIMEERERTIIDNSKIHNTIRAASLEIQNKMAEKLIHDGCNHT